MDDRRNGWIKSDCSGSLTKNDDNGHGSSISFNFTTSGVNDQYDRATADHQAALRARFKANIPNWALLKVKKMSTLKKKKDTKSGILDRTIGTLSYEKDGESGLVRKTWSC